MGAGLVAKLQQEPDLELTVTWLPFELHPDTPDEGVSMEEYSGRPPETIKQMHEAIKQRAAELDLDMEPPAKLYNSRPAHLLAEYARDHGIPFEVQWPLFQANFLEGRNLADPDVLRAIAQQAGLDPDDAMAALENPEYEERVNQATAEAQAAGITGVPAFVINDRYLIVGAQPYEYIVDALRQVQQEAA